MAAHSCDVYYAGLMLPESIRSLVLEEQARQDNRFVEGIDVESYLAKLEARAEILSDCLADRCRGFVAFYCNDNATRQAFITLVLVDPRDRELGVGRALVSGVLALARGRGFTSCRLEVTQRNEVAQAMYLSLGFRVVESNASRNVLEVSL
jgi:ribosomal protein S18 acetylase RimI-like enzyme